MAIPFNYTPTNAAPPPVASGAMDGAPPQPSSPNLGQLTAQNVLGGAKYAWDSVKTAAQRFAGVNTASPSAPEGAGQAFGQELSKAGNLVEGGLGAAAGAVQSIFSPLTATVQRVSTVASNNPTVQKLAMSPLVSSVLDAANNATNPLHQWAAQNPRAAKDLADTLNVALAAAGGEEGSAALEGDLGETAQGLKSTMDQASHNLDSLAQAKTNASTQAKADLVDGLTGHVRSKLAEEWQKPAQNMQVPGYKNARAVLTKNPEVPTTLSNLNLDPTRLAVDGKYATDEAAQTLEEDTQQLSSDMLRPALQRADYFTPKTPVSDAIDLAVKKLADEPQVTPGDRVKIIAAIKQEGETLQQQYPNGMKLEQMHDNKLTYQANGGYNQFKSNADNNAAIANRSIGKAFKQLVEQKAPPEAHVKEVNQALQTYHAAADYLKALNGKPVPKGVLTFAAREAAHLGGVLLSHSFGGGLLADAVGYRVGGLVERSLEGMSSPLRNFVLRNIETSNPAAFSKIRDYTRAPGPLALPPATSDTPIPLGPASTPEPPPMMRPAAKAPLPAANPKTGRMMRVYRSTPKS